MLHQFFTERRRRRVVHRLRLDGDRPAPPLVADYVEQAAAAFEAPFAALSVIAGGHQHVKARCGFDIDSFARDDGFCTHALDRDDPLEVCDASEDSRFATLPSVTGELHVRYYIGVPLRLAADGPDVGVLCIADHRPRPPCSPDQRAYLVALARRCAAALAASKTTVDG